MEIICVFFFLCNNVYQFFLLCSSCNTSDKGELRIFLFIFRVVLKPTVFLFLLKIFW
jgi:hypothetical protein